MIVQGEDPTVSIIMATYNRGHLIEETLTSLIRQSFEDWECLIIDDGSHDDTEQIVQNIIGTDERFQYLSRGRQYSKGLPGARNNGLDLARGEFIMFVDDDDILHPENLKVTVSLLKGSDAFFCRFDKKPFVEKWTESHLDEIGKFEEKLFIKSDLEKMVTGEIPFASCTVLWNQKCFQDTRFDEDLMYAEEWECYTRILSEGFEGISIDQILYYNRKHSRSNTTEFWENEEERVESYIMAALEIIDLLKEKNLFTSELKKFFLRQGFSLRSKKIIQTALLASNAGRMERIQYRWGLKYYRFLRPIFYIKGKIMKN
ncbi:glycosyltransferase family 2 protein [Salinimicrobium terrae]|uniref:glycosyltransferase family 2 protein n=1 Tax=Salinimicrobium terrae TaxID=470866 RepID=UPI00041D7DCC|nr:glycosyltransferase family 2 protein [Salinimicrobium terrae]